VKHVRWVPYVTSAPDGHRWFMAIMKRQLIIFAAWVIYGLDNLTMK